VHHRCKEAGDFSKKKMLSPNVNMKFKLFGAVSMFINLHGLTTNIPYYSFRRRKN
jgi:hypothetical protein